MTYSKLLDMLSGACEWAECFRDNEMAVSFKNRSQYVEAMAMLDYPGRHNPRTFHAWIPFSNDQEGEQK